MKVLSAVAWPYANGPRHIGHVAGFGVPSDVFSRYMRMAGHDVLMVSGTDEHGTPDPRAGRPGRASPRASSPTATTAVIAEDLTDLGCSYDLFTRTTTANHYAVAQELFTQVWRNGYMVEQTTQGAISPSTGRTLPDRYIEGTCPICGYGEARGDQCDNCGNQLDPTDLIDPRSRINGETPTFVETQHFLLDLPALADALRRVARGARGVGHLAAQRHQVQPQLLDDVRPRAMTRDLDWGIPVPLEGWRDNPTKRLYVWFDAVVGYLSASIEWARRTGDPERWREWWNDPEAVSHYFLGKDNITFHSPDLAGRAARLRRQGQPRRRAGALRRAQPARPRSSRASSSRWRASSSPPRAATSIHVRDVLERLRARRHPLLHLRGRPGEPGRRLHLARLRAAQQLRARRRLGQPRQPHGGDGRQELRRDPAAGPARAGRRGGARHGARAGSTPSGACSSGTAQKAAIAEAMRVVGEANAYVSRTEPFKLKGDDQRERLATVLHTLVQCVSDLNTMLAPFLPHAANRVHAVLGGDGAFVPMPRLETVTGSTTCDEGRAYPVITGDYSPPRAGSRARSSSARRSASRPRSSPSSTSRWSTRSSPGRRGPDPVTSQPSRRGRPSRPTRCRSRSSTTTSTSTSAARATRSARRPRRRCSRRLARSGSTGLVQVGCDLPGARFAVEAADRYPGRARRRRAAPQRGAGAGGRAVALDAAYAEIERLAAHPRVRVVGETGLDYFRTGPDGLPAQQDAFRWHIDLAKRPGTRPADPRPRRHDDVLRILDEEGAPERTVLHCFSGDPEMARECVERGYHLSFAARSRSRTPRRCATPSRSPRSSCCWSRPTRPTSTPHP